MTSSPHSFVILPAAGMSVRMGQPKLLLPWRSHNTILDATIAAWQKTRVSKIVVVLRADDSALRNICEQRRIESVLASPPPEDMKRSVQLGLLHVQQRFAPRDDDVWLLSPADLPQFPSSLIDQLWEVHQHDPATIVVPTFRGRRGHPVLFPWPLAEKVHQLAPSEGVNALARHHPVHEVSTEESTIVEDIDTPEDYETFQRRTDR